MRISKHVYFMSMAIFAAKRSTCIKRQIGCVAVKDGHVVATGYNGSISGTEHCTIASCYRLKNQIPSGEKLDMCYAVHAEQNVICQAASHGTNIQGATIYITTNPCITCLKLLAQVGVRNIIVLERNYLHTDISEDICQQLGITYESPWNDHELNYLKFLNELTYQEVNISD